MQVGAPALPLIAWGQHVQALARHYLSVRLPVVATEGGIEFVEAIEIAVVRVQCQMAGPGAGAV